MGVKIAIDLGTANSLVMLEDRGIVVNEPSYVAFSKKNKKVIAIGTEAKNMLGRSPQDVVVKRPLRQGVIAHYKLTQAFLNELIRKALGKFFVFKPEIMVAVPAGLTSVEERAVMEAVSQAGASKVYLIPEPIAASLGALLPIEGSIGNMIINMGAGTAEIAVVTLNGLVQFESKRMAGDALNDSIMSYIKKKYNLYIGEQMAENIKITIGSAIDLIKPLGMEIRGSDITSGMPRMINLHTNDIVPAIKEILEEIIKSVRLVLERTPPELASDVIDQGIVLSGGTSLIRNIDILFSKILDIPVFVADDPLECTVRGVYEALKDPGIFN